MKNIRNIWKDTYPNESNQDENVPLAILERQAKAINEDKAKTDIIATVISITNSTELAKIKHILYLLPVHGNNYNYRFVEFNQPIGSYYPVTISAYQQGETSFGECYKEDEIYDALEKIYKDKRRSIVFEQLKNIGETVKAWNQEKDEI